MPCFGLDLDADFGFARAHAVEADSVTCEGASWVFRVADREVYRIPQRLVRAIAELPDRPAAIAWLKARQRSAGGRGLQGAEVAAARLGQAAESRGDVRSAVVEGVQVRLDERGSVGRRGRG